MKEWRPQHHQPHFLYRLRDENGTLLYVGVARSALARLGSHELKAYWWNDVHSVSLDTFTNLEIAMAFEKIAIKTEKPLHNGTYVPVNERFTLKRPGRPRKTIVDHEAWINHLLRNVRKIRYIPATSEHHPEDWDL